MSEEQQEKTPEEQEESLFWEYLEEEQYDYQRPQRGEIRKGVIMRKDEDQIIVDIGAKREAIVPSSDLQKLGEEAVAELQVGEEVPVYVLQTENREGDVIVSINLARQMADWEEAERLLESNEIIERKIVGYNKGGLLAQVGHLQGFIPRSHIVNLESRTQPGSPQERLSQLVGQTLPLKVIEVNQRQRRLILSERAAWHEWRDEQKKRLLESLQEGDVRKGKVTSLAEFGAFVDLGGADGLIHISELSWDRGKKPEDVLKVGDEVEVKVIHVDRERKRIGLSLKQMRPNPWETVEERYAIGQYVDVVVTNLVKFGAFASIEEGIEGLIHISELSDEPIQHPSEVVRPGDELTVQIISIDPERRRIGLSLRRVPEHLRKTTEEEAEAVPAEATTPEEPAEEPAQIETAASVAEEPIADTPAEPAEEAEAATLAEPVTAQAEEASVPEPAESQPEPITEAPVAEATPDASAEMEGENASGEVIKNGDHLTEEETPIAATAEPADEEKVEQEG